MVCTFFLHYLSCLLTLLLVSFDLKVKAFYAVLLSFSLPLLLGFVLFCFVAMDWVWVLDDGSGLRVLAALIEDPSSNSRESGTLFWLL